MKKLIICFANFTRILEMDEALRKSKFPYVDMTRCGLAVK